MHILLLLCFIVIIKWKCGIRQSVLSYRNYNLCDACMPLRDSALGLATGCRRPVWHRWCSQVLAGRQHSGDAAVSRKLQPVGPTAHVSCGRLGRGMLAQAGCSTALYRLQCTATALSAVYRQLAWVRTRIAECGLHDAAWKATHTGYSEHYRAKTKHRWLTE